MPPSPRTERRVATPLTEEEIEMIAEKAAEKAVAKMTGILYREVGRTIIQRFVWIVGVLAVTAYIYLQQKGIIK